MIKNKPEYNSSSVNKDLNNIKSKLNKTYKYIEARI